VEYNEDGGVDILLDGNIISVTFNLWAALKHFRYLLYADEDAEMFPRESRLWVDAVCINQQDLTERSAQVRQMRLIYQRARCVNSWLGPEANNSSLAWQFVETYGNVLKYNDHIIKQSSNRTRARIRHLMNRLLRRVQISESRQDAMAEHWIITALKDLALRRSWNALAAVHRRSYWSRIWIVQELLSNQHTWVHCGQSAMPLATILGLGDRLMEYFKTGMTDLIDPRGETNEEKELFKMIEEVLDSLKPTTELIFDRESYQNLDYPGHHLHHLLCRYMNQLSSDPRDTVYALLGLSREYPQERLTIDYTLPTLEVFKATASYMIRGSRSLEILYQVAGGIDCSCAEGAHLPSMELPSWIPDWCCRTSNGLGMFNRFVDQWQYPEMADGQPAVFSSDNNVITCSGFEVGIIENIYHMDKSGWDDIVLRGKKFVRFVLSAEGVLVPGASFVLVKRDFLSTKLAELYKTMCLTVHGYPIVQKALSERQFEDMCLNILLRNERITVLDMSTFGPQFHALGLSWRGRSWFNTVIRMKQPTPSLHTAMGVCTPTAQLHDKIVVLRGCRFPVLLRERPEVPGTYRYVGEVYLHGFMHGEGVGKFEEQPFKIH
jgi:hypothetical protein